MSWITRRKFKEPRELLVGAIYPSIWNFLQYPWLQVQDHYELEDTFRIMAEYHEWRMCSVGACPSESTPSPSSSNKPSWKKIWWCLLRILWRCPVFLFHWQMHDHWHDIWRPNGNAAGMLTRYSRFTASGRNWIWPNDLHSMHCLWTNECRWRRRHNRFLFNDPLVRFLDMRR